MARLLTPEEWEAREAAVAEDAYRRYEADELDLNGAFQLVQAVRIARREADTAYHCECLEGEARWLEVEAQKAEATAAEMLSGEFHSSLVENPVMEAVGMRDYASKHRGWARQRRLQLVSEVRTLLQPSNVVRPAPRPREHRPRRQRVASSRCRARAPDEPHPDEPLAVLRPA